jgi:hypothetical protein
MFSEEVIAPQTNRNEKFEKKGRKQRFFERGIRNAEREKVQKHQWISTDISLSICANALACKRATYGARNSFRVF